MLPSQAVGKHQYVWMQQQVNCTVKMIVHIPWFQCQNNIQLHQKERFPIIFFFSVWLTRKKLNIPLFTGVSFVFSAAFLSHCQHRNQFNNSNDESFYHDFMQLYAILFGVIGIGSLLLKTSCNHWTRKPSCGRLWTCNHRVSCWCWTSTWQHEERMSW